MRPEWSLPVVAARIPAAGQEVSATADAATCAAVAARLGLPAIGALGFTLRLVPQTGGAVAASGRLDARLTQVCVVTLEPFESELSIPLDLRFVDVPAEEGEVDPDAPDEIPMEAGVLDAAEAVVESLSLALDPYPRAPGAALPEEAAGEGQEGGAPHPFAGLARRIRGGNA